MKVTFDEFEIDIEENGPIYDSLKFLHKLQMEKRKIEMEKQYEDSDAEIIVFQKKDVLKYYYTFRTFLNQAIEANSNKDSDDVAFYLGRIYENLRINTEKIEGENGSGN